jgi:hypothetical protein
LIAQGPLAPILGCALALAAISALDDAHSLPVEVRLSAHATAAVVAVLAMSQPPALEWSWGWTGAAAAVVAIVWVTNLFNFMDGADGLAGGMAALGFGTLATASALAGIDALALTWRWSREVEAAGGLAQEAVEGGTTNGSAPPLPPRRSGGRRADRTSRKPRAWRSRDGAAAPTRPRAALEFPSRPQTTTRDVAKQPLLVAKST